MFEIPPVWHLMHDLRHCFQGINSLHRRRLAVLHFRGLCTTYIYPCVCARKLKRIWACMHDIIRLFFHIIIFYVPRKTVIHQRDQGIIQFYCIRCLPQCWLSFQQCSHGLHFSHPFYIPPCEGAEFGHLCIELGFRGFCFAVERGQDDVWMTCLTQIDYVYIECCTHIAVIRLCVIYYLDQRLQYWYRPDSPPTRKKRFFIQDRSMMW